MSEDRLSSGWSRAIRAGLSFRAMTDDDMPFMARLYAAARAEELAALPWSDAEKAAFVRMQFDAQHAHYRHAYPKADWLVTMRSGEDIGRLYIDRGASDCHIIDIAFMPEQRGKGLGSAMLADVLDEAAHCNKAVSIHVETVNPARQLYRRLGFVVVEDEGIYELMRWTSGKLTCVANQSTS